MELTIRKAERTDLPDILRLYAQVDDGISMRLEDAEKIFHRFRTYPNYNLFVAVTDGKVTGSFELLIMDNLAHFGDPSGIIEDVVVDEAHRSRGVGKKMMEFAMEECRKYKCYKLMLSSHLDRKRAHRFYERLGFEKHGYSYLVKL